MNELDIVLFKKLKIIEIGSVEKNIWHFKVGDFLGNPKIWHSLEFRGNLYYQY